MNSTLFNELITSFNKAEEASNQGNLWTAEIHSTKALRALDQIRTKLLAIRVIAYLQLGKFCKAYHNLQLIQETESLEKLSVERVYIMKKKQI